jgi:hypothetical protein
LADRHAGIAADRKVKLDHRAGAGHGGLGVASGKKRGRPKGSKGKPKALQTVAPGIEFKLGSIEALQANSDAASKKRQAAFELHVTWDGSVMWRDPIG